MIIEISKNTTVTHGIKDFPRNKKRILLNNKHLAKYTKENDSFLYLTFVSQPENVTYKIPK